MGRMTAEETTQAEKGFISQSEDTKDDSLAKKKDEEYADRWVGDVVIGSTGSSLCIRPSEAKKAMGLMRGETVRIVIWRAPARNKLPKQPDEQEH